MHYDLRLELDGVLKSWALPKGLPLEYGVKLLAIQTEDHPLEYLSFEGVIPVGQYGAGPMIVWDCGVYSPDEGAQYAFHHRQEAEARLIRELEAGKISFFLRGTKMKGSFALIRMKDEPNWLVIKHQDRWVREGIDPMAAEQSALSGLTIDDLKEGHRPAFFSCDRLSPSGVTSPRFETEPMLATICDRAFDDPSWTFEPKLDGYRMIARIANGRVELRSRRGQDYTQLFPEIVRQLSGQMAQSMTLDGELVAYESDGTASFHALQRRAQIKEPEHLVRADIETPCIYYCFDILEYEGVDLRSNALRDRKRYLSQVLLPDSRVQIIDHTDEFGELIYDSAVDAGFEGVVAKRLDSRYESGQRSKNWLKVKAVTSGEFVIGGLGKGRGSRSDTFGGLMLGIPSPEGLRYVGNVGSGFDERLIKEITGRLGELTQADCPFIERPPGSSDAVWVQPVLVAEVKFHEFTPDFRLRAPVFLRLREDVPSVEVSFPVTSSPTIESETGEQAAAVLEQLDSSSNDMILSVGGHQVAITNLKKIYWPADPSTEQPELTKRDLLRYLARVSRWMLRHTQDKPMTLIRFPEGIYGERFYQKHWDNQTPEFVDTIELFSGTKGVNHTYLACNNLATLLWLGQLGTLEFHVPHSRFSQHPDGANLSLETTDSDENIDRSLLNYPDHLTFDLDPYIYAGHEKPGDEPELSVAGFEKGREVAFWLKELLDSLGLRAYVKTSGKTGLHIFAPIIRNLDFGSVRSICETFSLHLLKAHPNDITVEWSTQKRTGKIFMDYNMNVMGKTLNAAYSPRALAGAAVSMPVTWEELASVHPHDFRQWSIFERLERNGDIWHDILVPKADIMGILA